MKQSRREFVGAFVGGATMVAASVVRAQQPAQTMSGPMEQDAYRPVKLEPKPGAAAVMSDEQRDDLEHQIKCQCGCVLDVYTCRTTDFSCAVSPAMRADIMGLVAGGYGAKEILAAFQAVYGERVLMSPLKQGFNLLGYIMPFAVVLAGGIAVAGVSRRWRRRAESAPPTRGATDAVAAAETIDATPDELDALSAAVRDDS